MKGTLQQVLAYYDAGGEGSAEVTDLREEVVHVMNDAPGSWIAWYNTETTLVCFSAGDAVEIFAGARAMARIDHGPKMTAGYEIAKDVIAEARTALDEAQSLIDSVDADIASSGEHVRP